MIKNNKLKSNLFGRLSKSFTEKITLDISKPLGYVDIDASLFPTTATTTKEELLKYFKELNIMRRMEIASDELYKNKQIRGFCHLYIGQESIALGMDEALTFEDPLITAYREHCQAYMRGFTPHQIISEMMSRSTGATKGKGGSMHYYIKKNNFYGGNGIVGAQIPVGTGLAFALKYQKKHNAAFAMFGDGSVNQGQFLEAANMAGLWKLPMVYVIENNRYGMGTSVQRSNFHLPIYSKFRSFPGINIDGMDVFTVREYTRFIKEYVIKNGPLLLEIDTYRYQGHSMSDPGISYRNKEEIADVRKKRDNIDRLKNVILTKTNVQEKDLKVIEKEVRDQIDLVVEKCLSDPLPEPNELFTDLYVHQKDMFIRGAVLEESFRPDLYEGH